MTSKISTLFVAVLITIALTAPASATTYTWTGAQSNLWSNQNNWNPTGVPGAGDLIAFPSGAANLTNTNDLPSGTAIGVIAFNGGGYTLNGNAIGLSGGVGGTVNGNTINFAIQLTANQSFSSNTYNGTVDVNGFTLMACGSYGSLIGSGTFYGNCGVALSGTQAFAGTLDGDITLVGAILGAAQYVQSQFFAH
jgi:hypothetical protein